MWLDMCKYMKVVGIHVLWIEAGPDAVGLIEVFSESFGLPCTKGSDLRP